MNTYSRSEGFIVLLEWSGIFVTSTFVLYCIIVGIQELKATRFMHARFFDIFGLFFEILIFSGGLFILKLQITNDIELWRIAWLSFFDVGLLGLIYIDIRKLLIK